MVTVQIWLTLYLVLGQWNFDSRGSFLEYYNEDWISQPISTCMLTPPTHPPPTQNNL